MQYSSNIIESSVQSQGLAVYRSVHPVYRLDRNTTSTSCRTLWPALCCKTIGNSIPGVNLAYPNATKPSAKLGILTHSQKTQRSQRSSLLKINNVSFFLIKVLNLTVLPSLLVESPFCWVYPHIFPLCRKKIHFLTNLLQPTNIDPSVWGTATLKKQETTIK